MDLEQRLRAALAAPDPGPAFSARVMARLGRSVMRRRSSFIAMGTVLVAAAAAAVVAWRSEDARPQPQDTVALVTTSDPAPLVTEFVVPERPTPEQHLQTQPESVTETDATRFTVLVMPLQHEAEDPGKRRPVEALHAAVLAELRKIPGITLRVAGETPGGAGEGDYVLTITNLAASASPDGRVALRPTGGGSRYTVQGPVGGAGQEGGQRTNLGRIDTAEPGNGSAAASYGSRAMNGVVDMVLTNRIAGIDIDYTDEGMASAGGFFSGGRGSMSNVSIGDRVVSFSGGSLRSPEGMAWVEIKVEPRDSTVSRYTFPVVADGPAGEELCSGSGAPRPPECMNPAQLAAAQVAKLRLQLFPVDAGYQQRVMARLNDASGDAGTVLHDLLPLLTVENGTRLDANTTRALFNHVARQPADIRTSVWRTLGPLSHPALVAARVESLRADPDRDVRLAVLGSLEADLLEEPLIRGALEDIDRGDPDAVVRAAARWALHGEEQWRSDVLTSLQDASLPYEARLAPLTTRVPSRHVMQMLRLRADILQEEPVRTAVMMLVTENLRDATHARTTGELLRLLGNVEDPDIHGLFLQLMRDPSLPMPVASAVSTWAINHQHDPRVRANLPAASATIPSGLLERMTELAGQAPPAAAGIDLTVTSP